MYLRKLVCIFLIYACRVSALPSAAVEDLKNAILSRLTIYNALTSSHSNATDSTDISKLNQDSLDLLNKNLIDNLHKKYNSCSETLEFVCGSYWFDWTRPKENKLVKEPLINDLLNANKYVAELLSQPVKADDLNSVAIEKQLYQGCIETDASVSLKSESLTEIAFKHIIQNASSWQLVDQELSEYYGHLFFRISEYSDNNKLYFVLEPPSSIELFDSYTSLENLAFDLKASSKEKAEFELAMHFFASLNKVIPKDDVYGFKNLSDWINSDDNMNKYWYDTIINMFNKHRNENINREYIIVRNVQYFHEFEKIVNMFSKEHNIVNFMAVKMLIDNPSVLVWNTRNKLQKENKFTYCSNQTKLYGVSYELLNKYEREDSKLLLKAARDMVNQIINVMNVDLVLASQSQMQRYLQEITELLMKGSNLSLIESFYKDLKLTGDYNVDIINYHKEMNRAIFNFLFSDRSMKILPFSIRELNKDQNRLMLKIYLTKDKLVSPSIHKEFSYGYYGTEIARFLYDLINNRKLNIYEKFDNKVDWLLPHAHHSNKEKECLRIKEKTNTHLDIILSEFFALKTAYQAMHEHYRGSGSGRNPFTFKGVIFAEDAIFIMSYIKAHCYWTNDIASNILKLFKEHFSAFNCIEAYAEPLCEISPFKL